MKDKFFEIYDINKTGLSNFVKKKDFENIFNLIGKYYDHDSEEEINIIKEIYKRDFLDKCEEGKSILTLSY